MSYSSWKGSHLILNLYVIPNAKKNEVVGPYQGSLKIKVTAVPEDNKANLEIVRLLSQWFKVPKKHVTLLKGQQSRCKQFRIESPKIIPAWFTYEK